MKIIITGATGFLGQYLVKELAPFCEKLFVLGRRSAPESSHQFPSVEFVQIDLTDTHLVETFKKKSPHLFEVDVIIHAAALYDIQAGYDKAFLQNVFVTQNMLNLAKHCSKLKSFYYISTIAVGDDSSFFLEENALPRRKRFNDHYSKTKYLAEKIVRESKLGCSLRIIRPGIIVGDSQTGHMPKGDGPYFFMDALKKHLHLLKGIALLPLPYNPSTTLPIIPVDHCARFISLIVQRDSHENELKTYHLISTEIPTVQEFLDEINRALGLRVRYLPVVKNPIHSSLLKLLGIPKELTSFMFSRLSYDKTRTESELPEILESKFSDYKDTLFSYLA